MIAMVTALWSLMQTYRAACVLTGYTGGTTRGDPYFVDGSGALLAADDGTDLWAVEWGIGTGNDGEIMTKGRLTGLSGKGWSAGMLYIGQTGLTTTPRSTTVYAVGFVPARDTSILIVDIQLVPVPRY